MVEVVSDTSVWYHAGMPPVPIRWVLVRDPQGKSKPQAFLCTDLDADPAQVLAWFVLRWTMEVTFEEARAHLGIETQRQWSDLAIGRVTPALLGLFSAVTLLADRMRAATEETPPVRRAAWYEKSAPTFVDALAEVRRLLWGRATFQTSRSGREDVKVSRLLTERLTDALCYAA